VGELHLARLSQLVFNLANFQKSLTVK